MKRGTVIKLVILSVMLSVILSLIIFSKVEVDDDGPLTGDIDCEKCYYNQLKYGYEKSIYDKIKNIKEFESVDGDSKSKRVAFSVIVDDPYLYIITDREKIMRHAERAIHAASFDMPLTSYYSRAYTVNAAIDGFCLKLDIKLYVTDDYSEKTKSWYDQQITRQVDSISADINKLATTPDKIVAIHKYVIDTLSYDYDVCDIKPQPQDDKACNIVNRARSAYNALVGDHKVVCEGYAKMFKVLCDKCNVPCIVVIDEGVDEGHMWNYVRIDGSWYIVDCTWDGQIGEYQTGIDTTYLMSGADTLHQPRNNMNFKVPVLSLSNYGNWVTFVSDGVELFKNVSRDGMIPEPAAPEEVGKTFKHWYIDDENEPFDFSSPVTTDIILKAKWDEESVLNYDLIGSPNIRCTAVV